MSTKKLQQSKPYLTNDEKMPWTITETVYEDNNPMPSFSYTYRFCDEKQAKKYLKTGELPAASGHGKAMKK